MAASPLSVRLRWYLRRSRASGVREIKLPSSSFFYGAGYGPLVDMGRCSDLILCDARRVRYLEEKGDLTGGEIDLFQNTVKVDSVQPVDDRDGYSKRRIRWQRHALVVFGLVHDLILGH